ncbi:11692_t:CDS:1, partial [Ambispora gerdemannii]
GYVIHLFFQRHFQSIQYRDSIVVRVNNNIGKIRRHRLGYSIPILDMYQVVP